jgi:subtilisin-like proprotein convertase family protein
LTKEIEVSVDIKHTYCGDLRLTLKSPQSQNIILIDRSGGSEDDIIRSFRSSNEPALINAIMGTAAKGDWSLKIEDTAKQDVGVLVKWGDRDHLLNWNTVCLSPAALIGNWHCMVLKAECCEVF